VYPETADHPAVRLDRRSKQRRRRTVRVVQTNIRKLVENNTK